MTRHYYTDTCDCLSNINVVAGDTLHHFHEPLTNKSYTRIGTIWQLNLNYIEEAKNNMLEPFDGDFGLR